jgi:hypothetical protein
MADQLLRGVAANAGDSRGRSLRPDRERMGLEQSWRVADLVVCGVSHPFGVLVSGQLPGL